MDTLTLLIKPASSHCNMRCQYCFYTDLSTHRETPNYGRMSVDTLEVIIKKALQEASHSISIGFQGGEPMLAGLDFYKTLITLVKKHNTKNLHIDYSLQTNGTLMDDGWARFLAEHNFLTGISIDGYSLIHDVLRRDKNNEPTHEKCLHATTLLRKYGAQFNILTVVSEELAQHPEETYTFYKENDFRFIQFIPCIDELSSTGEPSPYSLTPATYGEFLCRLFDLWYTDFINDYYISIRAFDNYVHLMANQLPDSCAMAGFCQSYALIEASGNVYPCDFYALDDYLLGNIKDKTFSQLLESPLSKEFMKATDIPPLKCQQCSYYKVCRGGCRRDRELLTKEGLNKYCESYKQFFNYAEKRLQHLASNLFGTN